MNIRRFLSLGFVSVASIFWASCDSESNPQTPDNSQDPESSADAAKSSSSAVPESSAAEPESSAEAVSSSSEESVPPPSSSDIAQSSSSSVERLKLARDTSVTCSSYVTMQQQCSQSQSSEPSYSCMELQEFLKKDTTVSEKILNKWEEMLECEVLPFRSGIDAGADMVMAAHISAPEVTGSSEPASLSRVLMTEKLRDELGFQGVIVTDSFEMLAISGVYSPGEAAVKAILAGADIVLMPAGYEQAFDAVMAAVESGEISEERLEESVRRILRMKADLAGTN